MVVKCSINMAMIEKYLDEIKHRRAETFQIMHVLSPN